jgi:hypothetical protein
LTGTSLWDVIYPHCSYFSETSMRVVLEKVGFHPVRMSTSFEDQFLTVDAVRDDVTAAQLPSEPAIAAFAVLVHSFARLFVSATERWGALIENFAHNGRPVALWGAGAKATTFLNSVPGTRTIQPVVDTNPRKQGMFVPGTGQRIVNPAHLAEIRPGAVILLNSAYRAEVWQAMSELGITPELWVNVNGIPSRIERSMAA